MHKSSLPDWNSLIVLVAKHDSIQDCIWTGAFQKARVFVAGALAASAAGAPLDNVGLKFYSVSEQVDLTKFQTPVSVLCGFDDGTWSFDHPHVVRQRGATSVQAAHGLRPTSYGVNHKPVRWAITHARHTTS